MIESRFLNKEISGVRQKLGKGRVGETSGDKSVVILSDPTVDRMESMDVE